MPPENIEFWFNVTHVEADNQFLKIWAQTDEKVVAEVNSRLSRLQPLLENFRPNDIASPQSILPQARCCAKGFNNEFLRARIINNRSDGLVLVQFIDYGLYSRVPYHNIRLLDCVPEAGYLFSLPDAATDFVLADIKPIGSVWQDEVVESIRKTLVNNKYLGIYQNFNNIKTIKFNIMNNNFSSMLIARNMGMPCPMDVPKIVPAHSISSVRAPHSYVNNSSQENWRMTSNHNPTPVLKETKANSLKAVQLKIGSVYEARVSYVEEGPCKFSVQLSDSLPYLTKMMDAINSRAHQRLQESPIAGTVCLGQHSSTKQLCRVVLNSPGESSCKVYYADFGHHETLPFASIYQIPDEFVVPSVFSIRVTLSGIINWTVSQEMKDYFGGLVSDKYLKIRVCEGPMSPLTQYCELFVDGRNVKDILQENFIDACDLAYPDTKQLQTGATETVFVSYVESTAKFYVQVEKDVERLDEIMELVEKCSQSAAQLNCAKIRDNLPCIALFDVDKRWYRASILKKMNNENVLVSYVDYGNEEIVSVNHLREIPPKLVTTLPKQAIRCTLNGFINVTAEKSLVMDFENLVFEERLNLRVLQSLPETVIVDLYDQDPSTGKIRRDIAELMKSLAVPKKPVMERSRESVQESSFKPVQSNNTNENWNQGQGQSLKVNNYEPYDATKSKFRKENENELQHDNKFRKSNPDYANGPPNSRFDGAKADRFGQNDKYNQNDRSSRGNDFQRSSGPSNDRFNKGVSRERNLDSNDSWRTSKENRSFGNDMNSRAEQGFVSNKCGSDRDSDTSSRDGRRSNNRDGQRDDQRKRDSPQNNNNRIGRWEDNQRQQREDSQHKHYNGNADASFKDGKSFEVSSTSSFNKSKSSDLETSTTTNLSSCGKDTSRYMTSTPISKIPPPNITVGAIKNCELVYFINLENFYVNLSPDYEELIKIMDKIDAMYSTGGKVVQASEIIPDLQCIAQYSVDEQWYRAVVKSVKDSKATVYFIDYGNIETVSFSKIKAIESEFLKLPAQAINCKLFGLKNNYTKEESERFADQTDGKTLEAEFVLEENNVYQVLLRELNSEIPNIKYINDGFSDGIDLVKEKEIIRNKSRANVRCENIVSPLDYAPLNEKWMENKFDIGNKYDVLMAWFINPENFYVQLASQEKRFRDMMNEIQTVYVKRQPVSEPLQIGSSVIAILPDDGVLYRAEIVQLNKAQGHVVQYVDYGDRAMVDQSKIYLVEKRFMSIPKQAILCSLKNIAPAPGSNWSNSSEMSKFFDSEMKFECVFHEYKNEKYHISLTANGEDIGRTLVDKNLAIFSTPVSGETADDASEHTVSEGKNSTIDLNLLEGQILHVKVSSIENVAKFYVQFPAAEACQSKVDSFMSRKNSEMLKLPGQVSVMQNQAIECGLFNVSVCSTTNEELKKMVLGKFVKIFVEKIECTRLVVRLFDENGNKIIVGSNQIVEKVSPICNMPILSSTHEVAITWMNNSNSVWLQRKEDYSVADDLLQILYEFYSNTDKLVVPKENELYAALSADGNWYRVKVTQVLNNEAEVTLLDYGNIEKIPVQNFRTLESQFYAPHQLAIETSLTVSLDGSNTEQLDILEPLVKDKEFVAIFYNVNRKWLVELLENNEKLSDKLKCLNVVKTTAKPHLEHTELPEMIVGEKYNVYVTHCNNPSSLWLHRLDEVDAIHDFQDQLQEAVSLYQDCEGILEEKTLCLAKYSMDEQWYRAEVLDSYDEMTSVRFIDYGNTDVIHNNTGLLKQMPEKWKAFKRYAIQCKLDVLSLNGVTEWDEDVSRRLIDLTPPDKSLQALIITDKAPLRIDLFDGEQSISKLLISEKLAACMENMELVEEEIVEEERDPRSAFVSYCVSVDQFWLQEEKYVSDLKMFEDRLLMANILPAVTDIKEDLICVAHFPDDDLYYRAIVLSHTEQGTKVHYMDYGNTAITQDVRKIPEDLASIPPLSRKCCLAKPDGVEHWPHGVNTEFETIADNGATVFLLDVIEEGETCVVKLTHDIKDLALELLERCAKITPPIDEGIDIDDAKIDDAKVHDAKVTIEEERPPPIGEENLLNDNVCRTSYVCSPSEFWIHKTTQLPILEDITSRMIDAELFEEVGDIKEGKLLAAKFDEDQLWYRSKVLSHGENGTEVIYIDYGNTAVAESSSSFKELPEDMKNIQALAIKCCLKMPEGIETWSERACDKFFDLTDSGNTEFRFEIIRKDQLGSQQLTQLFYENQDIVDILLDHDKTVQNNYEESNESKERNISKDSAFVSEHEQHIIGTDTQSERYDNDSTEVCSDMSNVDMLCKTQISVKQEETLTEQSRGNESDIVNEAHVDTNELINDLTNVHGIKYSLGNEEKIVPGSICRGLSVVEIERYRSVPSRSFDDQLVPGSFNKGEMIQIETPMEEQPRTIAQQIEPEDFPTSEYSRISSEERILPSTVSRGEQQHFAIERPTTPKTPHSEKLCSGVVNPQRILHFDDSLAISVEENEDIPHFN